MHAEPSQPAPHRGAAAPRRVPLVLGNWKMNGRRASAQALLEALHAGARAPWAQGLELGVCPPFPYLELAARHLGASALTWGAQHVSELTNGAYTGEVSAEMLADLGCQWVLVGHSERRTLMGERDAQVAQRASRALAAQLRPVVCVGESAAEREAGQTLDVLARQLDAVLPALGQGGAACVVAYEPVWAIGTGVSASAETAQAVHQFIRGHLRAALGDVADAIRLLYGGSVKAANAAALLAQPDIDGALVGGASWIAEEFLAIARAAVPNI